MVFNLARHLLLCFGFVFALLCLLQLRTARLQLFHRRLQLLLQVVNFCYRLGLQRLVRCLLVFLDCSKLLFELLFQSRQIGASPGWFGITAAVVAGIDRVKGIAAREISAALAVGYQTPDTAGVTADVEAAYSQTAGNIGAHISGAYTNAANF
jgi:hypothetical protein